MSKGHFKIEIELPREILVALGKDSDRTNTVPVDKFPPKTIAHAVIAGFSGALGNISKAGVATSKKIATEAVTDDMLHEARNYRMKAWFEGVQWGNVAGERGDNNLTAVKEYYIHLQMGARFMSQKAVESEIRAMVTKHFDKDTKATFDKFMLAVAMESLGKDDPENSEVIAKRDEIEKKWTDGAEEARKKREEAAKKLDTTGIVF